jgi:hypothetical protein
LAPAFRRFDATGVRLRLFHSSRPSPSPVFEERGLAVGIALGDAPTSRAVGRPRGELMICQLILPLDDQEGVVIFSR